MAAHPPLSSGLAGCCKSAHAGNGWPESEQGGEGTPRPYIPGDIVRRIDGIARKLEREEQLHAMSGGPPQDAAQGCRLGRSQGHALHAARGLRRKAAWQPSGSFWTAARMPATTQVTSTIRRIARSFSSSWLLCVGAAYYPPHRSLQSQRLLSTAAERDMNGLLPTYNLSMLSNDQPAPASCSPPHRQRQKAAGRAARTGSRRLQAGHRAGRWGYRSSSDPQAPKNRRRRRL
jgi:hypothetical protein